MAGTIAPDTDPVEFCSSVLTAIAEAEGYKHPDAARMTDAVETIKARLVVALAADPDADTYDEFNDLDAINACAEGWTHAAQNCGFREVACAAVLDRVSPDRRLARFVASWRGSTQPRRLAA